MSTASAVSHRKPGEIKRERNVPGTHRNPFKSMLCFDLRDEWSVTNRLRERAVIPRGSRVIRGIGDDCAVYRTPAEDLLFTCDMLLEGVHFLRETHKPAETGHKALARSLSDIAAMGGSPRFCLVALSIPSWAGTAWVNRFFDGLLKLADATGTVLAGGDLSHGDKLACDVTVCGAVPKGEALLRSGARSGDEIYVSGLLGGSALGLAKGRGAAWKRHVRIEPRLALGTFLRHELHARAGMDLSDGLSLDLRRMCLASGLAAEIAVPPRFPGATDAHALHGGEDYELLFTVGRGTAVPAEFCGLPLTRIGRMVRGPAGEVRLGGEILPAMGYDHFGSARRTVTP